MQWNKKLDVFPTISSDWAHNSASDTFYDLKVSYFTIVETINSMNFV